MSNCRAVLIVEDEPAIREVLVTLIETEGYHVLFAEDGIRAMEVMASMPQPALVLLDLMMPRMSGWDVLKAMRIDDHLATIPVIVTSAVVPHKITGANDILKKPYDLDTLLRLIRKYCSDSSLLTESKNETDHK
jgi:CheY-like chemotaxis protein